MNPRLYPMKQRCSLCGVPLRGSQLKREPRACSNCRAAAINDPIYQLEILPSATGGNRG